MALQRTPVKVPTTQTARPATRSQNPELLLGVGKHPVAPTRKTVQRTQSLDTFPRLAANTSAREPETQINMVNQDEPHQGAPPALQNWESFCQALYGYRPPLPEFHGRPHEDPAKYLKECETYFTSYQIPETHRTKAIEKGLKNEAEKWWQCYKTLNFDWQRFKALINERFDSATVRSELTATLYSKKQGEKEDVGAFLQEKYQLFQRIQPDVPEVAKIQVLLNLIKPSLRKILRPITINDFPTLINKALQAEKDDNEEIQSKHKATSSKEDKNNVKTANGKDEQYLPKCWYCPGRHLNKDCEVYKKRQHQRSENWRQTSETPATNVNKNECRTSATPIAQRQNSRQ